MDMIMDQNMIKEYLYDFTEGRISVPQFLDDIEKHPEILDWIQELGKDEMVRDAIFDPTATDLRFAVRIIKKPFNIRERLQEEKQRKRSNLTYHLNVHGLIAQILRHHFPDNPPVEDESLSEQFDFLLDVAPSYIGVGIENEGVLEEIVNAIPKGLSKPAAMKWANKRIKEAFHIEGRKYPHWFQEPEWPVYEGRPMKYVRTEKINREAQNHIFVDLESGIERTVLDAF